MTNRRTPITNALACRWILAAALAGLGTAQVSHAELARITLHPSWGIFPSSDVSSGQKPPSDENKGLALAIVYGFKHGLPQKQLLPPTTRKAVANYGALVPIAGTRGSDYCIGSTGVAVDPSGKYVFMSGGIGSPGRLCGFAIDDVTEAWTPVTPPGEGPVAAGNTPRGVAIDPSGQYVYVAAGVNGTLSGFAIDRGTGVPTPLPGSPFETGGTLPTPIAIDRGGRFVYVGQSVGSFDGSIAVMAIDGATGALSHIPGSPFPGVANDGRIAALALSPDGRWLFAGGASLATYALNPATGAPTRIASRSGYYYGLAVDPTSRFIFGVEDTDDRLHAFSIAADGALSPAGIAQSVGSTTRVITAITSVSDLVYVGNPTTGTIYGFRINHASGALTPVAGSPFATAPLTSAFASRAILPSSIEVEAGETVVASVNAYGGRPPYTWSIAGGALPPGSTLNATSGVFSGTLSTPGTYSFIVQLADSLGSTDFATKSITVLGSASPTPVAVVEFYNASLDHYFITHAADEITKLDNGTFKGWARTGLSFSAFTAPQGGTSAVCRIYIPPGKGDGHFFGRDANECDGTMAKNPTFILESGTFLYLYPPALGNCAAGQVPVYRVFSNRADANHRYTTSRAVRDQMVGNGWLAEGDGADTVVMCAPA